MIGANAPPSTWIDSASSVEPVRLSIMLGRLPGSVMWKQRRRWPESHPACRCRHPSRAAVSLPMAMALTMAPLAARAFADAVRSPPVLHSAVRREHDVVHAVAAGVDESQSAVQRGRAVGAPTSGEAVDHRVLTFRIRTAA